jgi:hypothetical protein
MDMVLGVGVSEWVQNGRQPGVSGSGVSGAGGGGGGMCLEGVLVLLMAEFEPVKR